MNFSIFLIILSYVQTVFCSQSNVTVDETCDVCTISWFRRKRAQGEYTRWRANQETTQEFIVKVLDEDLTTHRAQKIVAVNIQPLKKNEKKIIIGGALVPPATTVTTLSETIDYTRFIPPTTIPGARDKANVRSVLDESVIMPPRALIKSENQISYKIHEPVKHIYRDESPPAGPQFLGRTQTSLARQYAPVAPVLFSRGSTIAPLTPRSVERFMYKTSQGPTRTSRLPDVLKPSRTTPKVSFQNTFKFDSNYVTDEDIFVSRSSFSPINAPRRTISTSSIELLQDENFGRPTQENFVNWRRNTNSAKTSDVIESDLSYNMIDEDKEGNSKIENPGPKPTDSEKDDDQYELPVADLELSNSTNDDVDDVEESDNSTGVYADDEYDAENSTLKVSTSSFISMKDSKVTSEGISRHKKSKRTCSMIKLRQLNFNSPRTLPEIVAQLKQWAETSPVAKWLDITNGNYTVMENPIYMMIVDDPSSGQIISAKKTVLVISGIQGRDHHAVAAAMYVLYQLIERSEAHADLLTKYRFWVIPIFNPDGYDYSMTFPHRREWSKNLRQKWDSCKGRESCESCESFGLRCTVQSCYGVNLDRNFEYQWIPTEELRAEHPCGALYAGERQLSEVETRALTLFLHERRTPLFTFIAFKEGEVLGILYPYSHTRKRRAFDNVYRQRASRAASAAYSIGGRPYVAGQTSEFLPLYAGGIEDWVDGHLGIDNTYTVMMFRPTDSYNSKLITERVVHEAYAALDTLLLQSAEPIAQPAMTVALATASVPPAYPRFPVVVAPIFYAISSFYF
ncbi:uncharacterized protein [Epargyreus clarus]|uniref:uncharacterized protein n=1 Tax=Epargyreus clarus TaxID=520877 RepID=UPI003C2D93A1